MTLILALDLATVCGFAIGEVGSTPTSGSIRFGAYGSNNNVVFGNAIKWISQFLEPQPRPRILILESMLPPDAMKGKTNRGTRDRLAGLHGIMRGVAHLRGIREITEVSVSDVRGHFIGHRGAKRDLAKSETRERCKRLGWGDVDADAADACAVWDFACCLIDPRLAVRRTPLFSGERING